MKRKAIRAFLRENRTEIDAAIRRALKADPDERVMLNDHEREMWLRNDEDLYLWARREGVRL